MQDDVWQLREKVHELEKANQSFQEKLKRTEKEIERLKPKEIGEYTRNIYEFLAHQFILTVSVPAHVKIWLRGEGFLVKTKEKVEMGKQLKKISVKAKCPTISFGSWTLQKRMNLADVAIKQQPLKFINSKRW